MSPPPPSPPSAPPPSPLHVTMYGGSGIGDVLMVTPALAAWARRHPDRPIEFHVGCETNALPLRLSLDVRRVHVDADAAEQARWLGEEGAVSLSVLNGREGHVRGAFGLLGLPPEDAEADRRLRYVVHPAERQAAALRLTAAGVTGGRVVAAQAGGNWRTKRWAHLSEMTSSLLESGAAVIWFGRNGQGPDRPPAGAIDLRGATLFREAVALVSLCDAYVGFDSGLTLAAMAVGTPVVALSGSHDPATMMGEVQAPGGVTFIRRRAPAMCGVEHGRHCREGAFFGQACPLRGAEGAAPGDCGEGADCLDAVTAAEVLEELSRFAPGWDGAPLSMRF